jgi:hypothetical protein
VSRRLRQAAGALPATFEDSAAIKEMKNNF